GEEPSTMTGELDGAPVGEITGATFDFQPTECIPGVSTYTCQVVITDVDTVILDQSSGTIDIDDILAEVRIAGPGVSPNCHIPVAVGPMSGSFDAVNNVAVLSSGTFAVPATTQADCGFPASSLINSLMGLPTTGEIIDLTLEFV